MLTRPPTDPPKPKARKQARYRQRQLDGLGCFLIDDVPVVPIEEMLKAATVLNVVEPDHEAIRVALKQLVQNLIQDHLAHCGDR